MLFKANSWHLTLGKCCHIENLFNSDYNDYFRKEKQNFKIDKILNWKLLYYNCSIILNFKQFSVWQHCIIMRFYIRTNITSKKWCPFVFAVNRVWFHVIKLWISLSCIKKSIFWIWVVIHKNVRCRFFLLANIFFQIYLIVWDKIKKVVGHFFHYNRHVI